MSGYNIAADFTGPMLTLHSLTHEDTTMTRNAQQQTTTTRRARRIDYTTRFTREQRCAIDRALEVALGALVDEDSVTPESLAATVLDRYHYELSYEHARGVLLGLVAAGVCTRWTYAVATPVYFATAKQHAKACRAFDAFA